MPLIFHDPFLQKNFEDKGYILLPSFLNKVEIDALNNLFKKYQNEYVGFFHTTHFITDIVHKKRVHDAITGIVFPKAFTYLNNFAPLFGNFMIKNADPNRGMDLHPDWAYVEEPRHHSVSIWIPLVDVNEKNGCLGIIEGSHKILNAIRGPRIFQSSRQNDNLWIKKYGKLLPMQAGDAILYNHALLHYSPPNQSNAVRPAINLSIASTDAEWIHYCVPEGATSIEKYSVPDSNFFINYNNFQKPETETLIRKLPINSVNFIDEKMDRLRGHRMINKMKRLFQQVLNLLS